jgi:hypothetical protein
MDRILKSISSGSHNAVGSSSLMMRMTAEPRMKETKHGKTRGKEDEKNAGGQAEKICVRDYGKPQARQVC